MDKYSWAQPQIRLTTGAYNCVVNTEQFHNKIKQYCDLKHEITATQFPYPRQLWAYFSER